MKLFEAEFDDLRLKKVPPEAFSTWIFLLMLRSRYPEGLPDSDDLARLLWLSPRKFSKILEELIGCGLVIKCDGRLELENWSERQPFEAYEEKSPEPSSGALRARRYRVRKAAQPAEHDVTHDVTRDVTRDVTGPRIIEIEKEKEKEIIAAGVTASRSECEFEELLSVFPRRDRCSAKRARREWQALMARGVAPATILERARRFAQSERPADAPYRPFLANWLKAERFEDRPRPASSGATKLEWVNRDDPLWEACEAAFRRKTGKGPPQTASGRWRFAPEIIAEARALQAEQPGETTHEASEARAS